MLLVALMVTAFGAGVHVPLTTPLATPGLRVW
jgi:hypothetical protein